MMAESVRYTPILWRHGGDIEVVHAEVVFHVYEVVGDYRWPRHEDRWNVSKITIRYK